MFTMKEAIEIYENNGGYFFSPATMKFFGSKVESELFPDRCFVTSEKMGLIQRKEHTRYGSSTKTLPMCMTCLVLVSSKSRRMQLILQRWGCAEDEVSKMRERKGQAVEPVQK